jgi:exopolysaccharide biosynthesis polyprenyl glycosylphosphotransferase
MHIEKRRTDRTKSPLSLVLIQIGSGRRSAFDLVDEVLDLLARSKRETDIVGYLGKHRVGLLLPHTGEQGLAAFLSLLAMRTAHLPVEVESATYPDDLFDRIAADTGDFSDTVSFFFSEKTGLGPIGAFLKRTLDIVGALAGILLLAPIMLVAAVAVAASSPGPVIFRQTRLGRGGAPFTLYKFRSMRTDTDDRVHREYVANLIDGNLQQINQGDADQPLYKMNADPRVTRVGRFLRKTSIDELPQLLNVLKGDMSLVGPRPPLSYEVEKYQSWHLRRILQVRPGITGLWQVEGRSKTSFDDMVRLDLRYIRHWSLWLDIKLLLKTVQVVLRRDGAG